MSMWPSTDVSSSLDQKGAPPPPPPPPEYLVLYYACDLNEYNLIEQANAMGPSGVNQWYMGLREKRDDAISRFQRNRAQSPHFTVESDPGGGDVFVARLEFLDAPGLIKLLTQPLGPQTNFAPALQRMVYPKDHFKDWGVWHLNRAIPTNDIRVTWARYALTTVTMALTGGPPARMG